MEEEDKPSRQVLEETPVRVLQFLRGVGTSAPIRAHLAGVGYTKKEHDRGWVLLHKASGHAEAETPSIEDQKVRQAIVALDNSDESIVRRVWAALKHRHRAQYKFVCTGVKPTKGIGAVLVIETLLDRFDALEKSDNPADRAALATLTERGFDQDERKRLREQVTLAQSADLPETRPAAPTEEEQVDEQEQALLKLYAWYEDWSETAHATIRRRDHLIRLGLARRRPRRFTEPKGKEEVPADQEPETKEPAEEDSTEEEPETEGPTEEEPGEAGAEDEGEGDESDDE